MTGKSAVCGAAADGIRELRLLDGLRERPQELRASAALDMPKRLAPTFLAFYWYEPITAKSVSAWELARNSASGHSFVPVKSPFFLHLFVLRSLE